MNTCQFQFFDLQDKTVLITGTTKGIGKAALPVLLEQGLKLISISDDRASMQEIRRDLGVDENRLRLYQCDLANAAEVESVAREIASADFALDAIWHNAGIGRRQTFETSENQLWQEMFQVNVFSAVTLTRHLLPKLKASGRGRILLTSSVLCELGGAPRSVYASSKGAVEALTRSLAHELKHSGITVNCLVPGAIPTGNINISSANQQIIDWQSVGRRVLPLDMLGPACLLLSEAGGGISGQMWKIDGGLMHPLADPDSQEKTCNS